MKEIVGERAGVGAVAEVGVGSGLKKEHEI